MTRLIVSLQSSVTKLLDSFTYTASIYISSMDSIVPAYTTHIAAKEELPRPFSRIAILS